MGCDKLRQFVDDRQRIGQQGEDVDFVGTQFDHGRNQLLCLGDDAAYAGDFLGERSPDRHRSIAGDVVVQIAPDRTVGIFTE